MSTLKIGDIVRHPKVPEWGRGIVAWTNGSKIQVFFENVTGRTSKKFDASKVEFARLEGERVPLLEYLRFRSNDEGVFLDHRRVSFDDLVQHFIRTCPGRFADELLLRQELSFKRAAREVFVKHFGQGRGPALVAARDVAALTLGFEAVLKAQEILLSLYERAAFSDAMVITENVLAFGRGLFEYLDQPPGPKSFDRYVAALETVKPTGKQKVTTWPILTLFPFFARPEEDAFLKPEVTKEAADVIGVPLDYDATLNWQTYDRLLLLMRIVQGELAKRGMPPRDHLEAQSFLWVALKYP